VKLKNIGAENADIIVQVYRALG